jgi:hypothetical protein
VGCLYVVARSLLRLLSCARATLLHGRSVQSLPAAAATVLLAFAAIALLLVYSYRPSCTLGTYTPSFGFLGFFLASLRSFRTLSSGSNSTLLVLPVLLCTCPIQHLSRTDGSSCRESGRSALQLDLDEIVNASYASPYPQCSCHHLTCSIPSTIGKRFDEPFLNPVC